MCSSNLFLLVVSLTLPLLATTSSNNLLETVVRSERQDSPSCTLTTSKGNTKWWRAEIEHDGTTPYRGDSSFRYYRTVVQFGADPNGVKDSSDAFNNAIRSPNRTGTASSQPAYVYIPPGTYLIKKPIEILMSTFLVGDPLDMPTLVGDPALVADGTSSPVINGHDAHQGNNSATKDFYMAVRNLKVDTTNISPGAGAVGMDWSVSQGCSLTNVHFIMPTGAESKHIGVTMAQMNSGIIISDCTFTGGAIGIEVHSQQYLFKGLVFVSCKVGISFTVSFVSTIQGCTFKNCDYGVDMGDTTVVSVSIVDSSVSNCIAGVKVQLSGGVARPSLVLDNFAVTGAAAVADALSGSLILNSSVPAGETWVMGNVNPGGYRSEVFPAHRPAKLLVDGKYFTAPLPQYEGYDISQFISVKGDPEFTVYGDNSHDDGPAINKLLQKYAGCKIVFFPQGIYRTKETIYVPSGSRIIGEVLSVITGAGSYFEDTGNPRPVVKVGNEGEKGVAQVTDMAVSVADVLPGAILVEVNLEGEKPGDVGFWNCVFRVGGTADTLINCPNPDPAGCKAAFALLHVTKTASSYFENTWGWVADHNVDNMSLAQNIAVGRGALVESTAPTWFIGTSFEHCVIYQYAFRQASNVYMALQQTESPYWQGEGTPYLAPSPWEANSAFGDPTFENCASQGQSYNDMCYRAWASHMSGSNNVVVHGAALWAFFNNMDDNSYLSGSCENRGGLCQLNAVYIEDGASTYLYTLGTKATANLVYDTTDGGVNVTTEADSPGSWGGGLAAYLRDVAGSSSESDPGEGEGGDTADDQSNNSTSTGKNTASRRSTSPLGLSVAVGVLYILVA